MRAQELNEGEAPDLSADAVFAAADGPSLPLELRQDEILFNHNSDQGLPLSSTVGDPYGSNGLAPANPSVPPTEGQFRGFSPIGGSQPESLSDAVVESNSVGLVLSRVRVGAPMRGQAVSFLFGEVVPPPDEDEDGDPLSGEPEDYWELEPFDSGNVDNGYYWSPHANQVFAVDPGTIDVIWQRRESSGTTEPDDAETELVEVPDESTEDPDDVIQVEEYTNYTVKDGHYFRIYNKKYIVSGGAVKTPQILYWNAGDFDGPDPVVPKARVGALEFVYTSSFPETVPEEEAEVIQAGAVGEIVEPRTIWIEKAGPVSQIQALNVEGRVFMEILGDLNIDGATREHLGFEIVDVFKQATPINLTTYLGEKLETGADVDDETQYFDSPVDQLSFGDFVYRSSLDADVQVELFAIRETQNLNDVLIHWMVEGQEGLRWPAIFGRYALKWPESAEDYVHYVRSDSTTDSEARETAVSIAAEMVPVLEYQDSFDAGFGAFLADQTFYTVLPETEPVHRSLLRYSSGTQVAFERVLSWREDELASVERTVLVPAELAQITDAESGGTSNWANGLDEALPALEGAGKLVVADGYTYVVSGADDSLSIFDTKDPSSPVLVYTLIYSTATGSSESSITSLEVGVGGLDGFNTPTDIVKSGDLLVIAALSSQSIVILDVSIPSLPTFVARISDTDSNPVGDGDLDFLDRPVSLAMDGDLLAVGNGTSSSSGSDDRGALYLFDLSIPTLPVFRSRIVDGDSLATSDGSTATIDLPLGEVESVISGDRLFLTASGQAAVYFLDVSEPKTPILYHQLEDGVDGYNNLGFPRVPTVSEDGSLLLVASSGSEDAVTVMGIDSTSGLPTLLSEFKDGDNNFQNLDAPLDMAIEGSVLAIAALNDDALTLVSLADATNPELFGEFFTGTDGNLTTLDGALGVALENEVAYVVANVSNSLTIIDAPDPTIARWAGGEFAGSIAEKLSEYDSQRQTFSWSDELKIPRVVYESAYVGERIQAPEGESGANSELDEDEDGEPDEAYLAGYITSGTSYNPNAYLDPFDRDLEAGAANEGSIIPVNVLPDDPQLTVWWFRDDDADTANGFKEVMWPSIIGHYELSWPEDPRTIVLASNDGSGGLSSLPANGQIYYINEHEVDGVRVPGYNPNEEHALMLAGQAYALRDDLNLVDGSEVGVDYSSEPYVLLEYTDAHERIAMIPFQVLREDPANGHYFNFLVDAGTVLQAPMPLPFLDIPVSESEELSDSPTLNTEVDSQHVIELSSVNLLQGDDYLKSTIETTSSHLFCPWVWLRVADGEDASLDSGFYAVESQFPSGLVGYSTDFEPIGIRAETVSLMWFETQTKTREYSLVDSRGLPVSFPDGAELVAGDDVILVGVNSENLTQSFPFVVSDVGDGSITIEVPDEHIEETVVENAGFFIVTRYTFSDFIESVHTLIVPDLTVVDGSLSSKIISSSVAINVLDADTNQVKASEIAQNLTITDRKGSIWVYRGPHDDTLETFSVQYYYNTLEGFYFPSLGENDQPEEGTITPYLRVDNDSAADATEYITNVINAEGQAQPIVYTPVWPSDAPELHMAESLTLATRGLPDIRGNSSLEIVYDQGWYNSNFESQSAVLHDPTREKEFFLNDDGTALAALPASVNTVTQNGLVYFPNLPPHLSERFFFDDSRGEHGALVFKGEFIEETVGENYILPNVLSASDSTALKELASSDDPDHDLWDEAIDGLETVLELFQEDDVVAGTYVVQNQFSVGASEISIITDDDVAVDSYALTAVGQESGFVSLIAGNGEAFTEVTDPVSVLVLKVVENLHPGEVKVVLSSNPLSEKLTMQQVVDLAGSDGDGFIFDWRLAPPVDGEAPDVATYEAVDLLVDGIWNHVVVPDIDDTVDTITATPSSRVTSGVSLGSLVVLEEFVISSSVAGDSVEITTTTDHYLEAGASLIVEDVNGSQFAYVVDEIIDSDTFTMALDTGATSGNEDSSALDFDPSSGSTSRIYEPLVTDAPQSYLYQTFVSDPNASYSEFWLSVDTSETVGMRVTINGIEAAIVNMSDLNSSLTDDLPGSSSLLDTLPSAFLVDPLILEKGDPIVEADVDYLEHTVIVELYAYPSGIEDRNEAIPGDTEAVDVRIQAISYQVVDGFDNTWLPTIDFTTTRAEIGGTADVKALSDNWVIMRYGQTNPNDSTEVLRYSEWTEPQLAEGWIKRVLAGINPFNQRTSDLFNNAVDTDASMLTLAGPRWEGDIALNEDSINDYGLIQIYETVLNRGRNLSIDAGINYGPANDALLLASSYINDLYTFLGDEAWSDALNPTIGIGTDDANLGDIATALFAFKGQTATLLEEELALLRGRDDFLPPGVEASPVYNRLFWNYTRGIDSGEVIYALNYNIQESQEDAFDGVIDAEDAAVLYPQGHGDAYGHYLTALKGYYSLLIDEDFDWVPRTEAVLILGQAVQVDYTDERKFAASAAAVARAGKQVTELTRRQDYQSGDDVGWEHLGGEDLIRVNDSRASARYWGVDHWATRTGQGAFVNWLVGNAILPDVDDDPEHEGIQVVDRQTVPELTELAESGREIQTVLDGAESRLNPLGLTEASIPFDINPVNPSTGGGIERQTHYEQIFARANRALQNAVVAFDDAKDVTRSMRSEENSLEDLQQAVVDQELAYEYALIELYGTPYSDDIGPGNTYETDYDGPDLINYEYVDNAEMSFSGLLEPEEDVSFRIDIQDYPDGWDGKNETSLSFLSQFRHADEYEEEGTEWFLEYTLGSHGFFEKPSSWTGKRRTTGQIQEAIGESILARNRAFQALRENEFLKYKMDRLYDIYVSRFELFEFVDHRRRWISRLEGGRDAGAQLNTAIQEEFNDQRDLIFKIGENAASAVPNSFIAGLANGGDLTSGARSALKLGPIFSVGAIDFAGKVFNTLNIASHIAAAATITELEFNQIVPEEFTHEKKQLILEIDFAFQELMKSLSLINESLEAMQLAQERVSFLIAKGDRLQAEREVFRKKTAAAVQGFRTRDAGFRIFRDEKLERYNALFDLAAKYTYLAAQSFDYETGLLHTDEGKGLLDRIIRSRALGVTEDGKPQFAGSNTGDPGLSSVLAELDAEWQVLEGRLGFNAPDIDKTTVSLRMENFRIVPDSDGDTEWQDQLIEGLKENLLDDEDIVRHCMQIDSGDGLPVPGIVIEFSTTIADGYNLFGQPLSGGDHAFSPTTFATKIFSAGVALEGYPGMDELTSTVSVVGDALVAEPSASFLDPNLLSATPYIYLIPVGLDSMRSPPLGDQSVVRTWDIQDLTVPLPFNIGSSEFSSKKLYQSSESLTEDLFEERKHQAFRAVSSSNSFPTDGRLFPSFFTNNRLIGRSIWNSRWKLVIPGRTLSNNPDQGLDVFIESVKDIVLNFETVSYAGN